MGYESVTDEKINQLVGLKKKVTNPNARKADKGTHYQHNYTVEGDEGSEFQLYVPQNKLIPKNDELLIIENPFYFPDGDPYQIYVTELPTGLLRLGDMGHTMMHLSYENDIDKFRQGTRGELFDKIITEMDVNESGGQIFIDCAPEEISQNIFRLGQALTKIYDLTFLNRLRIQATFYEDLKEELYRHVPEDKIHPDFVYEEIENASDYPIDYYIHGKYDPLYVFGIPSRDKARLTTIVLERLL